MASSFQLPTSLVNAEEKFKEASAALRASFRQCCEHGSPSSDGRLFCPRTIPRQICRASSKHLQSLYYHGEWARRYRETETAASKSRPNVSDSKLKTKAIESFHGDDDESKAESSTDTVGGKLRQLLRKGRKEPEPQHSADSQVGERLSEKRKQEHGLKDDELGQVGETIAEEAERFSINVVGRNYNDSLARTLAILVCCEREDGPWLTSDKEAWDRFTKYCLDPESFEFELNDRHLPLCKNCCRAAFGEHGARDFHDTQAAFAASIIVEGPMQDCDSESQMTCAKPISVEESLVDERLPDHFKIVVWNGHWISSSGTVDEDVACHRYDIKLTQFENFRKWESVRQVLMHRQNVLHTLAVQKFKDKVSLYYNRPTRTIRDFMDDLPPATLDDKLTIIKRVTDLAGFIADCHNLRSDGMQSGIFDFGISLDSVFVADPGDQLGEAPFKIADFMITKMKRGKRGIDSLVPSQPHKTLFTSPELKCGSTDVDATCDVWSFGCLLLEILGWTFGGSEWYQHFRDTCFGDGNDSLLEKDQAAPPDSGRRHSIDFREFKLNSKVTDALVELENSLSDATERTIFSTLSDITRTKALLPSQHDRSPMTDIHGSMLQAYYSILRSASATGNKPRDASTTNPDNNSADLVEDVLEKNVSDYMKTLDHLYSDLQSSIESPTEDESEHFCPHTTPREFFKGRPYDLNKLLSLTCQVEHTLTVSNDNSTHDRITGDNEAESMSKILATFCAMHSKADTDRKVHPCSYAWKVFVRSIPDHTLQDGDFPKDVHECKKIFGDDRGVQFFAEQSKFWPVVLIEGHPVEQKGRPMPILKEERKAHGSSGEIHRSTLAKGAVQWAKGDLASSEIEMARKFLRYEEGDNGMTNEWKLAQLQLDCATEHKNIMKLVACVKHDDGSQSFFMDYCEMDLRDLMADHEPSNIHLKPDVFLSKLVDLAGALKHFHNFEVNGSKTALCHLDLTPENILVDGDIHSNDYRLKLTDLHVSRILGSDDDGSEAYARSPVNQYGVCTPPEMEEKAEVDPSCDIWSFGCVLASFFIWSTRSIGGLEEFNRRRRDREDSFFIREDEQAQVNPVVLDCLQDAADTMSEDLYLGRAYRELHSLLINNMLCILPKDRCNAEDVYQRLGKVVELCGSPKADKSQTLRPTQTVPPSHEVTALEPPTHQDTPFGNTPTEAHEPHSLRNSGQRQGAPRSQSLDLSSSTRRGSVSEWLRNKLHSLPSKDIGITENKIGSNGDSP